MKNLYRNTAPANTDPFMQAMLERSIELAQDRRMLPITINTAVQRTMAVPLCVNVSGDHGEGTLVSFMVDKDNHAFSWNVFQERFPAKGIEWPLRMKITADNGESVTGILRERSTSIERRYFPK